MMDDDMTQIIMDDDMKFIQDLFKKFVPAVVSSDGRRRCKRPIFTGWLNVTAEESVELARCTEYKDGPFIFLTGKATKYIAVDLDIKDMLRKDHANKHDGVSYYTNRFGELEYVKTLLISTPSGGYHLVYKYEDGIKSGQLEKDVLIDILSDKRGMCFGPGYGIVNRTMPSSPPRELVQQIFNVQNNINCGQVNNTGVLSEGPDYSDGINKIIEADWIWEVLLASDRKCYSLVPLTRMCMVNKGHEHTDTKHSRLVVSKTRVTAKCFSHGESAITGEQSKQLRSLLFHDDIGDSFEDVMNSIVSIAKTGFLGRRDGFIWKVNKEKPWIYTREASYEDFANRVFAGNPVFMRNPRKFADMLRYMESIEHPDFPFLKKSKSYIGFRNCFLNIETFDVGTTEWDGAGTVPRHYIDHDFSWDNMYTPLFDCLLQHQLGSGEVYGYFLGLIGRLLFDAKQFDNYNVVPLVKGDTGTGKSTLLAVVQGMFANGSIGILNSNNETTFGLETMYDKELLVAHEIGDHFTHRLASDLFKQMVCGEEIHIPRKNKSAIDIRWRAPLFLCSNVHLSYKDVQGSISRRLVIFRFDNYVEDLHKDTSLEAKILGSELPAIIAKCLHAYKVMLDTIGNESFWRSCPDYFSENIDQMKEETDYIYMFLTLPPGDNIYGGNSVYFMKDDNASMLLQDFKRMFINYMKYRHAGVRYKWTSDYSSIKKLGYEVEYGSICKGCGQAAKIGCCDRYSVANRSRRFIIKYLKCVEVPVQDLCE